MLRSRLVLFAMALAGCAAEVAPEPAAPVRGAQERACAVAVAAHVGKGVGEVTAEWSGETADGAAVVTVHDTGRDGDRVHDCDVDGAGRVLALRHTAE